MRGFPILRLSAVLMVGTVLPAVAVTADRPKVVNVTVDVSEVPELREWADQAKTLVEKWHPIISELLRSEGFTPPSEVKLVFKKDMKGVAATTGRTIAIAANWVKQHPDDYGMVVHELTHVVQTYPRYNPVWLVEGIADYVRFFKYEPETQLGPINPRTASYRDGYRTTAQFLAWIEKTHDERIVHKLNRALRRSEYREGLFKEYTDRSLDELWAEFLKSLKK